VSRAEHDIEGGAARPGHRRRSREHLRLGGTPCRSTVADARCRQHCNSSRRAARTGVSLDGGHQRGAHEGHRAPGVEALSLGAVPGLRPRRGAVSSPGLRWRDQAPDPGKSIDVLLSAVSAV